MDVDILLTRMAMRHPFIASIAARLKWVPKDSIQTLCTDGRTVYYNHAWTSSLPVKEQMFCMAHECLHALLNHCAMMPRWVKSGLGPDGLPYQPDAMNKAMDFLINGSLVKEGFTKPTMPSGGSVCHSTSYDLDYDLVKLYVALCKDSPADKPLDEHVPEEGESLMTPEEVRAAAIAHQSLAKGDSALVSSVLRIILPQDNSPWAALRDRVSKGGGGETCSWARPHRRLITRGIIAPSVVQQASPPIAIVVDVSGSCHKIVDAFLSHMASIVLDSRATGVMVAFVDDGVISTLTYDDPTQFLTDCANGIDVPLGGATDMEVGIAHCLKAGYTRCVVLTDGYTDYTKQPDAEVIWALTTKVTPPYGDVVYL